MTESPSRIDATEMETVDCDFSFYTFLNQKREALVGRSMSDTLMRHLLQYFIFLATKSTQLSYCIFDGKGLFYRSGFQCTC